MSHTSASSHPRISYVLLESGCGFLSGLLLAGTYVGDITSPLPIAIAATLSATGAACVMTGSLISYLLSGSALENLPLLFALVLVVSLRILHLSPKTAGKTAFCTGACVFLSGIGISLFTNAGGIVAISYLMTAILTGCATYFVHTIFNGIRKTGKIPLRSTDGCAAAVMVILTVAAFSCYNIFESNIGCLMGVLLTLIGAKKFRCAGGVICGALSTCGILLGAGTEYMPMLMLPISGLFAGSLAGKSRLTMTVSCFLFTFLTWLTFETALFSFSAVLNLFLGCVAFLFLDPCFLDKRLVTDLSHNPDSSFPLVLRLQHMADAIHAVREDTDHIASLLPQEESGCDMTKLVCESVCGSCRHKLYCWETHYERTLAGFRKLESQSCDVSFSIPKELSTCSRTKELCHLFSQYTTQKHQAQFFAMHTRESRILLFEQLAAAEEILKATGMQSPLRYSRELSETIRQKLHHYGYAFETVAAYYTTANRMMIELHSKANHFENSLPAIRHILSESLNVTLQELDSISTGVCIRYRLCQSPKFQLKHYAVARHACQETVSGDTAIAFSDSLGNPYLVLSDGMGTGTEAAIESRMTVQLFRRLISGGITGVAAIQLMNGLLRTKSPSESFATLDVAQFDLDHGTLTMMKSGAAATLIRHSGKVSRISAKTFPLGVTPKSESEQRHVSLKPDDMILMLSDGVSEDSYPFIRQLLENSNDLEYIVSEICEKASIFSGGNNRDDITVCGAKLCFSKI